MDGRREPVGLQKPYDGTLGSLLRAYVSEPESSYKRLTVGSLKPYRHYVGMLAGHVGERRIANVTGLDVLRWIDVWSGQGARPAAARFALAVLKAALAFGAICGHTECSRLREIISLLRIKGLEPRDSVFTVAQIEALRAAAHANGRHSIALATAFQFETGLRLWDVIGKWEPLDAPGLSPVTKDGRKWRGLM
jgi:hypothetical protein